ncbi:MAG TPA: VIT family protein [Acidimicrobiia bacterium]|nr:VIT family protein [Acidimicrobiia bacterium]
MAIMRRKNTKGHVLHNEAHMVGRKGAIRAGVLGANDGVVSIGALVMGIVAANVAVQTIWLTGLSALVAGAGSMAIGEYVSVASQKDSELADIARESAELIEDPEDELAELAGIYRNRGLSADLAMQVAKELTEHDPLKAHLRDELGITEHDRARPAQAAYISFFAFCAGGILPFAMSVLASHLLANSVIARLSAIGVVSVISLILLGAFGAKLGGAPVKKALIRVVGGGIAALVVTSLLGSAFA